MPRLLAERLLWSLLSFVLVAVVVFVLVELLPGDAATAYLGRNATPERVAALRAEMGLDAPAPERFVIWASDVVQGDLGKSLSQREPINDVLWVRLRNSLLVGLSAAAIAIPLAIGLGILVGLLHDRWPDTLLAFGSLLAMSIPDFVIGVLLIFVFSIHLNLFPAVTVVDADAPISALLPFMALPIMTLVVLLLGYLLRIMRTSMIDVLRSDYVTMAHLKGLPALRVVLWHALPSALPTTITASTLIIAWLIGNLVVIEAVFNYPGIGTLALRAIQQRDLPLVQAIVLVLAGVYILLNVLADILTLCLNPRLRTLRVW
jgi:peptide/nickel transport system permease protein